ncbi:hypothetical protein BDB01DRAFT_840570 [Pilobolus umbonatus]|nr:hypothetical protein BDB01DRAFT_840570 [Pilobolus umbonatus]
MPVPFLSGAKQLTIELAEPVIILRGQSDDTVTHVLQGEVNIVLTKPINVSTVVIQFSGKSYMLWPEGYGPRKSKVNYEKTVHEQNVILQSFLDTDGEGGILSPGLHRWPFEFLISNKLVETIEDEMCKVFYYVTATIHRVGIGAAKLRCRRDVLLLRTPDWSNSALTANSLPTTSIVSERRLLTCDVAICVEKSHISSGTHLPIHFSLTPNMKHVYIESISVVINEGKVYRIPEYQERRVESYDYKISLVSSNNATDPAFESDRRLSHLSLKDMRRALSVKNAHIPINGGFQHKLVFELPNCINLNHDTTFTQISIRHHLKINIELSSPATDANGTLLLDESVRSHVRLEAPITILDCRLKEDYAVLPTYEEAILQDSIIDDTDLTVDKQCGFFLCPCYIEFKKRTEGSRKEWSKVRNDLQALASTTSLLLPSAINLSLPPSYDSIDMKR